MLRAPYTQANSSDALLRKSTEIHSRDGGETWQCGTEGISRGDFAFVMRPGEFRPQSLVRGSPLPVPPPRGICIPCRHTDC